MPLRDSLIRGFIVYKPTAVFPRHLLSLLFQQFEVSTVLLVVDLVVERHQLGVLVRNIIQDGLLEAAPQIEVFQPDKVTLILRPLKDGLDVRQAGEDGEMKQTVRMPAS